MGYDAGVASDDSFCITIFRFPDNTLNVEVNDTIPTDFDVANSVLCDDNGNLVLYSNEKSIYNGSFRKIHGGETLFNPPPPYVLGPQSMLSLPYPGASDTVITLYMRSAFPGSSDLYYALTVLSKNQGEGEVISKQNTIIHDTLEYGLMTAVRHGNGLDWWILVPEYGTNKFYTLLLDKNGVSLQYTQAIGSTMPGGCLGQAVFSPDGTKYAVVGNYDDSIGSFLELYDFDRCNGALSNQRMHNWIDANYGYGTAFSHNSRFLYVSARYSIFQYDLNTTDWVSSRQTVAYYDGFAAPFGSRFYIAQLAPDNKIYINCTNGEYVMHVIDNPDLPGASCNVKQHAINLGCYNTYTIPNYPNFRLGKSIGSTCDTIISDSDQAAIFPGQRYKIIPNPTSGPVGIIDAQNPNSNDEVMIFVSDITGRIIYRSTINTGTNGWKFDLRLNSKGVYFIGIVDKSGRTSVQQLIYN